MGASIVRRRAILASRRATVSIRGSQAMTVGAFRTLRVTLLGRYISNRLVVRYFRRWLLLLCVQCWGFWSYDRQLILWIRCIAWRMVGQAGVLRFKGGPRQGSGF